MSDTSRADQTVIGRLTESEERYRAVIENASDMIQSVLPDASFEFVNRAWLHKMGYTADEVKGLIAWDTIHPESIEHCQTLFGKIFSGNGGEDETFENEPITLITKDGQKIPCEASVTTRYVDGKIFATHAFFRDITERLRAQDLEERNAQLEREQTARYLEKMAALGKLAAGLAHELNNPAAAAQRASAQLAESAERLDDALGDLHCLELTADQWDAVTEFKATSSPPLSGERRPTEISRLEGEMEDWLATHGIADGWDLASGLVQEGIEPDRLDELAGAIPEPALKPVLVWFVESSATKELTNVVTRSTQRISNLVAAVKAYSYMDRAVEQIVDVHEGIENTLVILGHKLRGLTVQRDFDRSLPPVRSYGSGLNQVWTNILDNAADATGDGGTITIRTHGAAGHVVVEIEDDGPGIPREHLSRVFEPFFSTKPQGEGTGLGLDTVWRIITEEHNGTVEVESAPGRTQFRVSLPEAER
ncbi:MAG TPA: ATP-binding protein [Dehalococcoidia bacterium]|nr:ATP-binding protein [Dehalococcoidia bacterium]